MEGKYKNNKILSRREFLGGSAAALTALSIAPNSVLAGASAPAASKPNSVVNGVHIGVITYNLRGVEGSAEGTLASLIEAGLSEVEMMGGPIQSYMGGQTGGGRGGGGARGGGGGARGGPMGMMAIQRPSRRERLAAVEAFEKQVTTLRKQIEIAPSVDPNVANLQGRSLTNFMDVYASESNTINEMAETLSTLSGVDINAATGGSMMGGRGGLTADSISDLLVLAKQDNATKLTARLESLAAQQAQQMQAQAARGRGGGGRGAAPAVQLTPEQLQAQQAQRYVQLARCMDMRKMYNDAGVNIHLHKMGIGQSEEAFDWSANVAKALGAVGMTAERGSIEAMSAVAAFAEKNKIWTVYHNHTNNFPQLENDPLYEIGDYVGFNFDIGHMYAGSRGQSPLPILEKYHDKIISIHLKDRTPEGGNLEWGQGSTPIKEAIQMIARNKWPIFCDIELEYGYQGNAVIELQKCLDFCREAFA